MKATLSSTVFLLAASVPVGAQERSAVLVPEGASLEATVALAARVVPAPRQLAWQQLEFQAFAVFGMNTFTDREWGEGTEEEKLFNPSAFDANQWVASFKAAGMKGLILTAKHHDGFCLWPTKTTEHCVRNSPWKSGAGDVVREVAQACRAAGLKFGIYLSPWDRNCKAFGQPGYNAIYREQLRELLTNYGPIHEVWMDGAHAPRGEPELFDWAGHYALVRELQPGAVISICGPDVRWCGNEAGRTRESEWSVVPTTCTDPAPAQSSRAKAEALLAFDCTREDIGSRERLRGARQLLWRPSQVDTSIRPGWFYHPAQDDKQRSLADLLDIYFRSVGGNSQLLLNVPPDRRGLIHEGDVRRLRELGVALRFTFERDLAAGASIEVAGAAQQIIDLGQRRCFDLAVLQEDIARGQRVEEFALETWQSGAWRPLARGTTIGYKRMVRFPEQCAQKLRLRILRSRAEPALLRPALHLAPAVASPEFIAQGEYLRTGNRAAGIQVVALGDGKYQWAEYPGGLPGDGWSGKPPRTVHSGEDPPPWDSLAAGERLVRQHRASPTLGAAPPAGALVLFGPGVNEFVDRNGKPKGVDGEGFLIQGATSKRNFRDFHLHLEFRLPFKPRARGQARGNSGVYIQGRYEVQMLDSFGLAGENNECGGIYGRRKPDLNMCYPPMSWQSYDIDFTSARYDEQGALSAPARISVRHNGVLVHDDFELPSRATTAAPRKAGAGPGPIYLQNHGNPVRYRNIWLVER